MVKPKRSMACVLGLWTISLLPVGCVPARSALLTQYPYLEPGKTSEWTPGPSAFAQLDTPAVAPTIAEFAESLLNRGPSVMSARQLAEIEADSVNRAAGLPDLQVLVTTPPVSRGLTDGTYQIEIMQMIPSPVAWISRIQAASARRDAGHWKWEAAVRSALTTLYIAYAEWSYTGRALAVVAENQRVAEHISRLGAFRFAQPQGTLVDVTRVMAQLSQLEFDRIALSEQRQSQAQQLAALAGYSSADAASWGPALPLPYVNIEMSQSELTTQMLTHQPRLLAADEVIREAEAKHVEAAGMWLPDLSIGAMIMVPSGDPVASHTTGGVSNETEWALMFGVSLPIWFYSNAAGTRQSEATLDLVLWEKKREVDEAIAQLSDRLFRFRNARRLFALYDSYLLPRAQSAVESALVEARQRGEQPESIPMVLEAQAAALAFSLGRERALADLFIAAVRIEDIVGVPVMSIQPPPTNEETP